MRTRHHRMGASLFVSGEPAMLAGWDTRVGKIMPLIIIRIVRLGQHYTSQVGTRF